MVAGLGDMEFSKMFSEYSNLLGYHPIALNLYVFFVMAPFVLFLAALGRGKYRIAYIYACLLIIAGIMVTVGDDYVHHVVRIIGLRDQVLSGNLGAMLGDSVEGTAYPIFLYYSMVPYVLPVALALLGLSGAIAFKLAMGVQFLVFAAGVEAIVRRGGDKPGRDDCLRYFAAILLISATYVYGLWLNRAAFGEICAISLVPWIAHFGLRAKSFLPLTALLFMQLCTHPLVFAHCLIAELIVVIGLSHGNWLRAVRPLFLPCAVALALSAPFWAPQFLWLDAIKGDTALPVKFSDTFLALTDLVDPTFRYGIAVLLAAVVVLLLSTRMRWSWRTTLVALTLAIVVMMQTAPMRMITTHLPVINLSQFVWRLMFPAAFLAFGVLLAAERHAPGWTRRSFGLLSAVSLSLLVFNLATSMPKAISYHSAASFSADSFADESGEHLYFGEDNVYGIGLFEPKYDGLPQRCSVVDGANSQVVSYAHLHQGLFAEGNYLVARHAPIGFVRYYVNGARAGLGTCKESLVIGPVPYGAKIEASEDLLDYLMAVRMIMLGTVALVMIVIFSGAGRKVAQRMSSWLPPTANLPPSA